MANFTRELTSTDYTITLILGHLRLMQKYVECHLFSARVLIQYIQSGKGNLEFVLDTMLRFS